MNINTGTSIPLVQKTVVSGLSHAMLATTSAMQLYYPEDAIASFAIAIVHRFLQLLHFNVQGHSE